MASAHTAAGTIDSASILDGRVAADAPEFVAEVEGDLSLATLSFRRCLAATWSEEVDLEGDFVELEFRLRRTEIEITLSGKLNDAQVAMLEPFAEMAHRDCLVIAGRAAFWGVQIGVIWTLG